MGYLESRYNCTEEILYYCLVSNIMQHKVDINTDDVYLWTIIPCLMS